MGDSQDQTGKKNIEILRENELFLSFEVYSEVYV